MKLTCLGQELDHTIEHELLADNEFGFTAVVTHKADSIWSFEGQQLVTTHNNLSEVHHLYSCGIGRKKIAFESDNIFKTGCNRDVTDLESVVITLATELASQDVFDNIPISKVITRLSYSDACKLIEFVNKMPNGYANIVTNGVRIVATQDTFLKVENFLKSLNLVNGFDVIKAKDHYESLMVDLSLRNKENL